mgnify:CR=1 FL=1
MKTLIILSLLFLTSCSSRIVVVWETDEAAINSKTQIETGK